MSFDLFTFIAQIINFLVLVFLLHKFLFTRIVEAIDRREERIRLEFQRAEEEKEKAKSQVVEYENLIEAFHREKEEKMQAAQKEAEERKESLTQQARLEIDALKSRWRQQLEAQKKEFIEYIGKQIGKEATDLSEKIIEELSGTSLQEQIADRFLDVLDSLGENEMQEIQQMREHRAEIATSRPLTDTHKERLTAAIETKLGLPKDHVDFSVDPENSLGLELRIDGKKLSWTAKDRIDQVRKQFAEVIERDL